MAKPTTVDQTQEPATAPEPRQPAPSPEALGDGVRAQRQHIEELTGEDPLRGGVAD